MKHYWGCYVREKLLDAIEDLKLDSFVMRSSRGLGIVKGVYRNNGYLMVSCNGGLNQMRAAICDMVTIARYLNVTLIVPELDKTSFWLAPGNLLGEHQLAERLKFKVICAKSSTFELKKGIEAGKYMQNGVFFSDTTR